jgi:hypothetical protein
VVDVLIVRPTQTSPVNEPEAVRPDTCSRCLTLRHQFRIGVPADLRRAIRIAKEHLADGVIVEVPSSSSFTQVPFSSVSQSGPWDDVLGYGFRCTSCGQLFSLSAETYHGSGGHWQPVARL